MAINIKIIYTVMQRIERNEQIEQIEQNEQNEQNKVKYSFKSIINENWFEIVEQIKLATWTKTENQYNKLMEINEAKIFPLYPMIFSFTNYLIPSDIKVCVIGQDCYHGTYYDFNERVHIPQATGLSFSVSKGCPIPSSLDNIYKNLEKFGHLLFRPAHGDLSYWAYQGVLMLNCALTVEKARPNSHEHIWKEFTDELLEIISTKYSNIIFVLWGKFAHSKKFTNVIKNQSTHKFIISSHPSGYSANSAYREFKSFMNTDHFGLINEYLNSMGKQTIDWQII